MNLYLPGAKVIKGADSGPMLGGARKVVWHTTENDPATTTATNIAAYLQRSGNTVHLVWNPISGEIVQMIPANLGGKGLENRAGGVQTNRGGTYVIQVEVVGRASRPFTSGPMVGLSRIQAWLASLGVPAVWSGTPDRSTVNWAKGGHFGHADVPENSHWDPGKVNKALLANAPTPTAPPTPEVDMPLTDADAIKVAEQVWGRFKVHAPGGDITLQAALSRLLAAPAINPATLAVAIAKALPAGAVTQPMLEAALRTVLGSVDGKV